MKKILLLAATALILIALACQKENHNAQNDEREIEKAKSFLSDKYGFQAENIELSNGSLIVEKDQRFDLSDFWENYGLSVQSEYTVDPSHHDGEAADRRQYRYTYLVTNSNNVVVTILPNVPQVWRTAITKAVADWNALNGRLKFSIQYRSTIQFGTINISMNTTYLAPEDYAIGDFPTSNGYPGKEIHLNPAFNNEAKLNANGKVGVVAHEIGHTIGFRHTDSGQGTLITNVSDYCKTHTDPLSVMSAKGDFYWGFTGCDKEAYFALYPK